MYTTQTLWGDGAMACTSHLEIRSVLELRTMKAEASMAGTTGLWTTGCCNNHSATVFTWMNNRIETNFVKHWNTYVKCRICLRTLLNPVVRLHVIVKFSKHNSPSWTISNTFNRTSRNMRWKTLSEGVLRRTAGILLQSFPSWYSGAFPQYSGRSVKSSIPIRLFAQRIQPWKTACVFTRIIWIANGQLPKH